jgi:hypothetical protein
VPDRRAGEAWSRRPRRERRKRVAADREPVVVEEEPLRLAGGPEIFVDALTGRLAARWRS